MVEARHGRFFYNANDNYVGRSLSLYGEWSESEVALFSQIVRPGDMVVEAGANIGSHTIYLSKAVGPDGRVMAFEASRHTHQLLCANLTLNECLNVHAVHKAVGAENGRVPFPVLDPLSTNNFGMASLRRASSEAVSEIVDIVALDTLGLERLDFLKADIEGHEIALLEGSVQLLETLQPVVYLEIDIANGQPTGNRDELVAFVERFGYAAYYYVAPMFNPLNFKGNAHDEFQASSIDMICVPESRATMEGLTRARVADGAFEITEGLVRYTTLPWNNARFAWRQQ